ncbi:MAG: hypothetical protein E7290_15725 [Lachnospiraceae bacterium]|nr:hypothetical protein [Lachnospiraceae bacterium]
MKKAINTENPKVTPEIDFRYYMNFIEMKFGRKDSVDTDNNSSGGGQKQDTIDSVTFQVFLFALCYLVVCIHEELNQKSSATLGRAPSPSGVCLCNVPDIHR